MEDVDYATDLAMANSLEYELGLIREAIALVATGGSPRVVLAGLQFAKPLMDPGRRLALESGLRLRPLPTATGVGADISVERIRE